MGVPKFYRFISERYPLINTKIENGIVPEMDNLYLDMNGIVHNCVRGDGSKNSEGGERYQNLLHVTRTQEDILLDVLKYIDNLFSMILPRKLLYFAIDGVAPRAKMNQQRSRRFRSAKERIDEHQRRLAEDPMYVAAESTPFDSNCISPGTEFMQKLTDALEYFVADRVTHNPQWADIEVVLSGAEAPGEGEHKIMEYIRAVKVAGKMPPNTRHCLYGLDADLIMLGLASHEPHFFLLREKVDFSAYWKRKGGPRMATQLDTITFGEFELLSIGLLREYLALDVGAEGNSLLPYFDVERIVDDFVFMLMLVGNDFLPHLPTIEIADGMIVAMMHLYRRLLPRMEGYLSESGRICPHRVELFVAKLAVFEPRAMKRKEREQRSRGPRGHNGQKTLFSNSEELDTIFGFSESSGVGASVYNYDIESEIANCRIITHSNQHMTNKRKYYTEKFGPEFAKDEGASISELSTHYIQGVVWTLKYYFEGCQSWRWYYPYHYAPFPSDLTGIAEKAHSSALTFSSDEPFLPLQQLMSVLPPASADCIPKPYRKLMTSPVSPVREFYIEDFKIDMNGKRNEWEAVVLLPFVDADRLFAAIATIPETDVTAAEKRRNTLGVSWLYCRDKENFSKEVKSPFPHRLRTFTSHAKWTPLSLPVIPKGSTFPPTWVIGTHAPGSASWVSDLPTLHPVPHAGKLEKLSVNLFGFPSRSESLAITLGSWEARSRDFIFFDEEEDPHTKTSISSRPGPTGKGSVSHSGYKAPESVEEAHAMGIGVGCLVWTHYPWRVAGIAEAVMDEAMCVRRDTSRLGLQSPIVSKTSTNKFIDAANGIAASLMEKGGVDIDQPKVLVEVNPLPSTRNSMFGSPTSEPTPLLFSAITVLTAAMARKEPGTGNTKSSFRQVSLSAGQTSLYVGPGPFFGNLCQVKELKNGTARVQYSVSKACAREPSFGYGIVQRWQSQRWKSSSQVAAVCSLAVSVANAFLGSVRVRLENGKDEIDLGLGIKYSSRGLLIPGYAKVNDFGTFFFSDKAIALLTAYKEAFPELFAAVHKFMSANRGSKSAPVYEPRQLFPNASDSQSAVMAIGSWISASEIASLPLVSSGSLVLPRDAILELERSASVAKCLRTELAKSVSHGKQSGAMSIVSQRQLRTGSEPLDWQSGGYMKNSLCLDPVSSDGRTLRLGDRVANRIAYNGTPLGLRGSIIGIHRDSNSGPSSDPTASVGSDKRRIRKSDAEEVNSSSSCTVEVIYDEEFIGGGDLNGLCTAGKGKAVPASSLYIIRPDRENEYYASNYGRVAKTIDAEHGAPTNGNSTAHAKRREKAIAAAAVESFKKALKPRVKKSDGCSKSVEVKKESREAKDEESLQVPPDPLTMPIPSFARQRPRPSPAKKPLLTQRSSVEKLEAQAESQTLTDSGDDVAALTAYIKSALGVVSDPDGVDSARNVPDLGAEGALPVVASRANANGHVGSSSGLSQVEKSPTRRKPRHRNRRQNPRITATLENNERSSGQGNHSSANDGFASVWNQLKSRSNDQ